MYYIFTVEGRGKFPFDMLRYDSCYPASSEAATTLTYPERDKRQVALIGANVTQARWESFGWRVITMKKER